MKLKKIQAEDWEAGTYAVYAIVGREDIQLTKVRERYHYHDRYGWGQYGSREVSKCVGLRGWIRTTRTRKELVNQIQTRLLGGES